jgi:hypothetical protein
VDAIEFAASAVLIGVTLFDVDAACEANGSYKVNQSVFSLIGDSIIFGYRRKEGAPVPLRNNGDRGRVAEAGGGGQASRNQQTKRRNADVLAGADMLTAGGAHFFDGQNRHRGTDHGSVVMGALQDDYDVR